MRECHADAFAHDVDAMSLVVGEPSFIERAGANPDGVVGSGIGVDRAQSPAMVGSATPPAGQAAIAAEGTQYVVSAEAEAGVAASVTAVAKSAAQLLRLVPVPMTARP